MRIPAIPPIASSGASMASVDRMTSVGKKKAESSFSKLLQKSIEEVDLLQKKADKAIGELVVGDNNDIARTMIAVEKASLSVQMMAQTRNKVVEAYQEIMRMQV